MARNLSPTKQRILLLLNTGAALIFARYPGQQFRAIAQAAKEWRKINFSVLKKEIRELYQSKLINLKKSSDGATEIILSDKGKQRVLKYNIDMMEIKHHPWDGKWRLVTFDIPEHKRAGRDALREKLQSLGFFQYQKSILVYPYECKNEIDFLVELFELKPFVRYIIATSLDNELHLKQHFDLL